jgi:hypothetical protein
MMERAYNNPRNTELLKFLNSSNLFNSSYLADKTQLTGDYYYPAADKVVLPSGNPGALVRELGHAIDVNSFANTPSKRLISNVYSNVAPDVWREGAAWKKGKKALLEGGARQNINPNLVVKALEDSARIKPYGSGNNWGTALGAIGGLGAGLGLSYYARKNDWPISIPTYAFPIAGGFGGALLGRGLGYLYGSKDSHSSEEARKGYMEEYVNAYAKVNNMSKAQARKTIETMAKVKHQGSSAITKAAAFGEQMAKQAIGWGGGKIGIYPKGRGVGGEVGYTNFLGLLPVPTGGLDIGGPKHGFKAGIAPDPETVISPYLGFRLYHPRATGITRNFPRGLGEVIYDKLRGQSYEDALRKSYPDEYTENDDKKDKEDKAPKSRKRDKSTTKAAGTYDKTLAYGLGGALAGGLGSLGYDMITNNKKDRMKRFLSYLAAGGFAGSGIGFMKDKEDAFINGLKAIAKPSVLKEQVAPKGDVSTVATEPTPAPTAAPAQAAPAAAPQVTATLPEPGLAVSPDTPKTQQPVRRGLLGLRRR